MKLKHQTESFMETQVTEMNDNSYKLITHQSVAFEVFEGQILSGSRISKGSYKQVVFSNCTFYACEFQGVMFDNCVFENCRFEFSHFRSSKFKNCNFTDCSWQASSTIDSIYAECDLGSALTKLTSNCGNTVLNKVLDHTTDIYIQMAIAA